MSFFNFFRRDRKHEENKNNSVHADTTVIDPALFIEDQKPDGDDLVGKEQNPISVFLSQEFEQFGYHEGYAYPDADYLDNKIQQMRAEFQLAVDKCLDIVRNELSELKVHMIKTEGISPRLYAQLEEKHKLLDANFHELDTQKVLSVADDGMIGPAVHSFRLGFRKGLDRYQQEKFIAGSTGLFNN